MPETPDFQIGDTVILRRARGFAMTGTGQAVQFRVTAVEQRGPDLGYQIKTYDRAGQIHNGWQPANQLARY